MKKSFRLIAAMLAMVMVFAIIPFYASAASLSTMKIVCFGDSLTHYGDGWTSNKDEFDNKIAAGSTYPQYLAQAIGATVYNAGVGGNTTDMALRRLNTEVLPQNPDIVVICLGANDASMNFVTNTSLTSIESYRKNLEYYVSEITKTGANVVFLTPSPACADAGCPVGSSYNYGTLPSYCNAMREVAIKYGITYVDANYDYGFLSPLKDYFIMGDGVHQSAKGRQYFASLVANHLKAIYENTNKATMTIVCKDQNGKEIKKYTISGAAGARLIVPSPDLDGYTATSADVETTFVNGATHTFTYTLDVATIAKSSGFSADNLYWIAAEKMYNMYLYGKYTANSDNIDFALLEEYASQMQAIANAKTSGEIVLSLGAKYTATAPNYMLADTDPYNTGSNVNPIYADDGKKLTDGKKGYIRGEDSRYSAWTSNSEIIVDLGEIKNTDVFRAYFTADEWGVTAPSKMTVSVRNSESEDWITLSASSVLGYSYQDVNLEDNKWSQGSLTVSLESPIKARYVKFNITKTGYFLWMDEVEVALKNKPMTTEAGTLDGINQNITGDDTKLFLGGFNFANNNGNLKYAAYVIAKYDTATNGFIITEVGENNGTSKDFSLDVDSILIAVHNDSGTNWNEAKMIINANVGQYVILKRIDTYDGTSIAPAFYISDENIDPVVNEPDTVEPDAAEPEVIIPDGAEKIKNNIAKGKSYTTSKLYAQDPNNGWAHNDALDPSYPDTNNRELTDGFIAKDGDYTNQAWVGLHNQTSDALSKGYTWVTVDLGNEYNVTKITLYGANGTFGVAKLNGVKFFDGNGNELGTATITDYNGVTCAYTLEGNFTASVIEARVISTYGWNFVSELAVEGTLYVEPEIPEEESSEEPVVSEEESSEEPIVSEEESSEEPVVSEEESSDEPVVSEEESSEEPVVSEEESSEEPVVSEEESSEEPVVSEEESSEEPVVSEEESSEEPVVSEEESSDEPVVSEEESSEEPIVSEEESSEEPIVSEEESSEEESSEEESSEEESSEPEESQPEEDEPEIMVGDVNGNKKIDMSDYVMLKRAYFGTFNFSDEQKIAGDINKNGKIDMSDYVLLKRAYFGTYVIK